MPIPDLSNKPGPGRPGFATGSYEFQFEVTGAVTVKANAAGAGNFRISWPNGTTQVLSSNNASVAAPDGTAGIVSINNQKLDTTYADEFAVVSGKTNVTKVISWGSNAWSNLQDAFNGCTNLTHVEDTKLLAGGNCTLFNLFRDCTGLVSAICKKWDLSLANTINSMFRGCSNLEFLDFSGAKIGIQGGSLQAFSHIGTSTTNGCEFKFTGLEFTNLANHTTNYLFGFSKIKPSSSFANIKFPATEFTGQYQWFYSSEVTGTNSVLDCSGWTTFNGNLASFWARLNNPSAGASPTNTNLKVNLTNFSGKTSSINGFVRDSAISGIIGLSTWGATDGTAIDFTSAFHNARVFAMDASDNFSNTFISSCNVSGISSFYNQTGNDYNGTLVYGAAPNLTNLNCANITSFASIFNGAKLTSNPDFNSITYPSTAISFDSAFKEIRFQTYSGSHIDFSTATLKISTLSSAFRGFSTSIVEKLTFGDNVDFSQLTSFNLAFYNFGRGPGNAFPTEITLPTNADYSSVTSTTSMFYNTNSPFTTPALSTCQVDYFIRNLYSSRQSLGSGSALTIDMPGMSITEAPSVVRSTLDDLVALGYNIALGATDATLPFAYANYAVDPTGLTTISPTTTPPAGSVFTATNSLNINSSTGVITIGSFRGGSTIRCTYPDGCYNEVTMLIQVPFVMRTTIPGLVNGVNYLDMQINPQMSAGECFVDWGDNSTQILTGQTTHTYSAAGDYDIKIFDSPNGSKFENFTGSFYTPIPSGGSQGGTSYNIDITQWGEIQWKNGSWFTAYMNKQMYIDVTAASNNYPDLSQATSLTRMFSTTGNGGGFHRLSDPNGSFASWDVSTITDMSYMFARNQSSSTPLNLANWDVSRVENFAGMFRGAKYNAVSRFSTINISNWKTSSATNMSVMFYNTSAGSISGIENLNTSLVTDLGGFARGPFEAQKANYKTKIVNAGTADEFIAWDVSKCVNFGGMFTGFGAGGGAGQLTDAGFPTNWKLSSDVNDNISFDSIFYYNGLSQITNADAFATKTILAADSPYGTQYTAWDVSRVSSFYGWNRGGTANSQVGINWNLSSWQVTSNTTTFAEMYNGSQQPTNNIDQDLGHWDVTGITANFGDWLESNVQFSTSNYDSLLDVTNGWGSQAASVQSGITVNFGTSKYTPGITIEGTTNGVGTSTTIYDNNKNFTTEGNNGNIAVGDILYNKDTNQYSKVLSFNLYQVVTDQPIWGSSQTNYRVESSNAARGRIALISAGWTITDGGAYIPPFAPFKIKMEVASNTQTTISLPNVYGPSGSSTYSFTVDWGDGATETVTGSYGSAISHTYNDGSNSNVSNPTISIGATGDLTPFAGFAFNNSGDKGLFLDVEQWGDTQFSRYLDMFHGCNNSAATITATDYPNLLAGAYLGTMDMFRGSTINSSNISGWDVSNVTFFYGMFAGSSFNQPLNSWDMSNAANIQQMFQSNTVFNQPLNNWDVRKVSNAQNTFQGSIFNQDISSWQIGTLASSLTMNYMFQGSSTAFNQNLGSMTISANMTGAPLMFHQSNMSTANYTDTLVGWANQVKNNNPDAPTNVNFTSQIGKTFDASRSGGANFASANAARNFLTDTVANGGAGWSISGDSVINIPYNSFKIKLAVTSGTEKTISLQNTGTSYTIDWGDGTVETSQSGTVSHTYNPGNSGTTANPIVSIGAGGDSGPFTRMISSGGNANNPVLEVTQWGDIAWTSMSQMFQNNYNILITATDSPDLSNCVSMNSMFNNCQNTAICTNGSMNNWDVSNINNMAAMFNAATAMNVDISSWDVSSVLSFGGMFSYAYAFNSNISGWDVSSGQYFQNMLKYATAFEVDIANWNVSSALNMQAMFDHAGTSSNTTQNLSVKVVNSGQASQYLAWYTPLCANFKSTFLACKLGKTNTDFQNWNVSSATNMRQMFDGYSGFNATTDMTPKSVTMGGVTWNAWDTSSVTTFYGFAQNSNLSQDISGWDVSAATNLGYIVAATGVNYIFDWTALNSGLTTMKYIFGGSSMSTNNYTDSIVHFANLVKNQNPNAPLNVDMSIQFNMTFDSNRSGGSNFTNAFAAREFLTNATSNGGAGWTLSLIHI